MARRQPGDVLMAPRLSLPPSRYGGVPMFGSRSGTRQPDGTPVIKVEHNWPGPRCELSELREVVRNHPRVALYLGFRYDEWPLRGSTSGCLETLTELGTITADKGFAGGQMRHDRRLSHARKVVEFARPDPAYGQPSRPERLL